MTIGMKPLFSRRAADHEPIVSARDPGSASGARAFGTPKPLPGGATKTSLAERVYGIIMESLDSGALKPGDRIVASELAQRLGLSRAPVREAIAVLAGQGLVELLPDRGAMLRPLTRGDLAAIYEVSAPVVAIGVKAAALRIAEGADGAPVAEAMAAIRDAAETVVPSFRFYLFLNHFHYVVNEIGGKPYVGVVMRALNIEYWNRLLAESVDLEVHAAKYVGNYQRMTDAVLAGDARSAEAGLLYHVDWCMSLLGPPG